MDEFNDEKQGISSWIQDNLRIILSIIIVIFVAGGIYSYSHRSSEEIAVVEETQSEEDALKEILNSEAGQNEEATTATEEVAPEAEKNIEAPVAQEEQKEEVVVEEVKEEAKEEVVVEEVKEEVAPAQEEKKEEVAPTQEENKEELVATPEETIPATPEQEQKEEPVVIENNAAIDSATSESKETENSFIEVAKSGNGVTHLARQALSDYLEKNPNSNLTSEHKIYIEDYLRKKIGFQDKVYTGTSVEFSKSLIQEAIDASMQLNDSQLHNLQKYSGAIK